jgi:hypothetical protein
MARTRTPATEDRNSSRRWSDATLVVIGGSVVVLSIRLTATVAIAHLPLDIAGGIGLGVACGGLARVLLGAPPRHAMQ